MMQSRCKAQVQVWASLCEDWKTLSVNPAVNGYLFPISEGSKEREGLNLSSAVPKIQWDSNPTALTAIRLWETFTFT